MSAERHCVTRRIKQARYLQRHHPDIVPTPEPAEGFGSILEGGDPSLRFALRAALDAAHAPSPGVRAGVPLFQGSLVVVRPTISGPRSGPVSVAAADAEVVRAFVARAAPPIARYASAYGPASVAVAPMVTAVDVAAPNGRYNDSTLQTWVNGWVVQGLIPPTGAAALVVNPPGALNTDADPSQGVLGYHGKANVPYAFVNVLGAGFTADDAADAYALATSHEVAEMTVDPAADLSNPEVCDPCGPNCQTVIRDYFDAGGAYLGSSTEFPPPYPYGFFLNAIVQPASATACPAPSARCAYAPP